MTSRGAPTRRARSSLAAAARGAGRADARHTADRRDDARDRGVTIPADTSAHASAAAGRLEARSHHGDYPSVPRRRGDAARGADGSSR